MKLDRVGIGEKKGPSVLPILGAAIVFPLSVFLWFLNYFLRIITTDDETEALPSPFRWIIATAGSVIIVFHGIRKKSLSKEITTGVAAFFVGFFLSISSYCFFACLLAFFFSSSKATKFRGDRKRKFDVDFKEGGQRNWVQVLCNGGMATELAILYLFDVGYGQFPIDFHQRYRASWLGVGILGALSCANGDTWASELGSVIGSASPRLITTWAKVPKGTNGGVSLPGLLCSFFGGLLIGLSYYFALILSVDSKLLADSPPQWPIIILGGVGGFLGSFIDSILGATVQFSGVDSKGLICEKPGPNIRHITGWPIFDNHSVNLLSTIFTGLFLPPISVALIPSLVRLF